MSDPKLHHYVPQFYLRQYTGTRKPLDGPLRGGHWASRFRGLCEHMSTPAYESEGRLSSIGQNAGGFTRYTPIPLSHGLKKVSSRPFR
jgi:hypothetical protein